MAIDSTKLKKKIKNFLKKEGALVDIVAKHDTEVFEAYCFASIGRFYTLQGYTLKPAQTSSGYFTFQYSTKSYPWNHSYLEVYKGTTLVCEIRHNQSVGGHWADAPSGWYDRSNVEGYVPQYQADIAIVQPGKVPSTVPADAHLKKCVAGNDLITFAEVKRMTATPMLMASFQGIVYMIKPHFVVDNWYSGKTAQSEMKKGKHPFPVLFTINGFSSNVQNIYNTMMRSQKAHISVATKAQDRDLNDLAKQMSYET